MPIDAHATTFAAHAAYGAAVDRSLWLLERAASYFRASGRPSRRFGLFAAAATLGGLGLFMAGNCVASAIRGVAEASSLPDATGLDS